MSELVKTETTGWLLKQFKKAAKTGSNAYYPFETGFAAKLINVTPTELKDSLLKEQLLRGISPPSAYLVSGKYYFLMDSIVDFNLRIRAKEQET